jgi:hypothetical protein
VFPNTWLSRGRQCSDDMDEREDSVTPENVNSSEHLDYDGNVYG